MGLRCDYVIMGFGITVGLNDYGILDYDVIMGLRCDDYGIWDYGVIK